VAAQGQPSAVRRAFWLWAIVAVAGIVLIRVVAWSASRWRRERTRAMKGARRRHPPLKDAWAEAGKRAETPQPDELEPEDDDLGGERT
jgi:hypothetical protein